MTDGEINSTTVAAGRSAARKAPPWLVAIALLTGFVAVLCLGLGVLFLVDRGAQVNIDIGMDIRGKQPHLFLHRLAVGTTLFATGVWFTLLTRGLWQNRRYGRVMGWMTVAAIVGIAILLRVA
jgi:hypothetical protein